MLFLSLLKFRCRSILLVNIKEYSCHNLHYSTNTDWITKMLIGFGGKRLIVVNDGYFGVNEIVGVEYHFFIKTSTSILRNWAVYRSFFRWLN
jgi:hypothetical protein